MTDQQVIEVQIVENLQRADLTALEEAKSYEQLHEQYKYDWPELAARVGKSQGYVFARLNLLKLIPEFQKLLTKGILKVSFAEAITALENPDDQKDLFKKSFSDDWSYPKDLDDLKDIIRNTYLLQLANAPFPVKDKDLQGGPCGSCPKRTGAQADLFGELVGKQDTCRDAKCWAAKKTEYEKKTTAKYVAYARAGHVVKVGAAAEEALSSGRYEKATEKNLNNKTWAELLKDKDYKTIIAVDAKGKMHELVNPSAASKLLHPASKKPAKSAEAEEAARRLELLEQQAENAAEQSIVEKIVAKIKDVSLDDLATLQFITPILMSSYPMESIAKAFGYKRNGANPKDAESLKKFLFMSAFENESEDTIKFFGLDKEFKDIKKQKLAELKAAEPKKKGKL